MDNFFVKDIWWKNDGNVADSSIKISSASNITCDELNQNSGFLFFSASTSGINYYASLSNIPVYPQQIVTTVNIWSGYLHNFDFSLKINNVEVFNEEFNTNGPFINVGGTSVASISGIFNPTENQLSQLVNDRHENKFSNISHNIVDIRIPSGISFLLQKIKIEYFGESYNNGYNNLTPTILNLYPTRISGKNLYDETGSITTNPEKVKGPTPSSGNDSTYVYCSGFNINGDYNANYIDFQFNTSGYFDSRISTKVDKAIFSIRYSLASGNTTNNQEFINCKVFSDKFDSNTNNIGWCSGFHLKNAASFTREESIVSFVIPSKPDLKFATGDLLETFLVRLYNPPTHARISAAQIDLYLSEDNIFAMNIPGEVYSKFETKTPNSGTSQLSHGKNRFRQLNYDESFFNIKREPLIPGSTINSNFTPIFWKNYFDEEISTFSYHNHFYNNSVFINKSGYFHADFDSTDDYTIFLHVSTSGNFNYLKSADGANLLNKQGPMGTEFLLNIYGDELQFVSYDEFGSPVSVNFDSYPNNLIVIIKNGAGNTLDVYTSNSSTSFSNVFSDNRPLRYGSGTLYIGGSGIDDFEGYLHEYGISNRYLDSFGIQSFGDSRFNMTKSIYPSGIELNIPAISGDFSDQIYIQFKKDIVEHPTMYQFSTPAIFAYGNWLTNPSSLHLNFDYKNYTNNPSGINISGSYVQKTIENGQTVSLIYRFNHVLPSGEGNIDIYPFVFSDVYDEVPNRDTDYNPSLTFTISSYNNQNHTNYLEVRNPEILFDGWFLPLTGISLPIDFYTNGYQISNDNFDFFLQNTVNASGVDFYVQGHSASNKFVDFYMQGGFLEASGVSFYTTCDLVDFDDLDLFLQGPLPISGSVNFFMFSSEPTESSGNFSLFTTSSTNSGLYSSQDFYLLSELDPINSINFFIGIGEEEMDDSINFFIEGDQTESKIFNMYVPNQQSNTNYELDFYSPSTYNQSGNLNMFMTGN